jgi:hypothetical protein
MKPDETKYSIKLNLIRFSKFMKFPYKVIKIINFFVQESFLLLILNKEHL